MRITLLGVELIASDNESANGRLMGGFKMTGKVLANKPLVEAIFELRWELQELQQGIRVDPHYQLLVGRMYDKVNDEYPFHQKLPSASLPDEIAGYIPQHRFRKGQDEWPLIQIGSGIVTLNDTSAYLWSDFRERINKTLAILFEVYPDSPGLRIRNLVLRYIDAIDFNFATYDALDFLKGNMSVGIEMRAELFQDTGVSEAPKALDLKLSFACQKPPGEISMRFFSGIRDNRESLMWETTAESMLEDAPQSIEDISKWIDEAHNQTHDMFFKNIGDELMRRFE